MNILLTSFRPFGGDCPNASQEVMNAPPDRIDGALLTKLCLPVSFAFFLIGQRLATTNFCEV